MKVSLNTIRAFNKRYGCADDIAPNGADDLLQKIGARLGAVEEVVDVGKKYQGIIIAKVVSCEPHPNADKLKICMIDDGGKAQEVSRSNEGYIQVVCGAPNARAGLLVAWLPPGVIVPESYGKDTFVLEAREIRGQISNGMLASPRELTLGDSHEGILEIDDEMQPGTLFADAYDLGGDLIIDLENKMFTHRPDCFGFLGISRELAGIQGMPFRSPAWYSLDVQFPTAGEADLPLEVRNEVPDLVSRFTAVTMAGVKVKPSPLWLQIELTKVGLRPVNNIVDYTNFFMLETGQPLHAYDYDKVAALSTDQHARLIVRKPHEGEKIKLLNGKELEPSKDSVMIATDKQSIGIGGVMGGAETEVDEHTTNIILECAHFDMYAIRRTAMEHGLFTDAVTRFTKGQSPLQNLAVLAKIVNEISHFAEGKLAGPVIDDNHLAQTVIAQGTVHPPITLSSDFINARLGFDLSVEEIARLLKNVEFQVTLEGDTLKISAPFWRTDIEIKEDIVEEVGRLFGYDHLPLVLPSRDLTPAARNQVLAFKQQVRDVLCRAGANETLTYSFVHGNLIDAMGQNKEPAFQLSNALSPDLQYYRMSLLPSLLEKIHLNVKSGYEQLAVFEMGKTHIKTIEDSERLPWEHERLALVFAAQNRHQEYAGAPYYAARKYLTDLLDALGVTYRITPISIDTKDIAAQLEAAPYEPGRLAGIYVGKSTVVGFIGEFRQVVHKALKLPAFTAGFELDLHELRSGITKLSQYVPLSRFPKVQQDISLRVSADTPYQAVYDVLAEQLLSIENTHAELEPYDIYQGEGSQAPKHLTFRFTIAHYEKTLKSEEVNTILDQAATVVKDRLAAERI